VKFSIVIPAHNEEQRLPPVLLQYITLFNANMPGAYELIVVANGCTDQTAKTALEIAKHEPAVKVIDEKGRIGKGGAVIMGVKAAVGEYIGFVDADGSTSAEEFYRLYQRADGSDGAIGSRWIKGADVTTPQKAMRLLSSRMFNLLIRTLLGLKFKDTQCGAKIFMAEAWRAVLPHVGITRFAFDVDLLFQLKLAGFSVHEEPTVWRDVAGSKVQVFNSSVEMFFAVVRMRLLYSPFSFTVKWYEKLLSRPVEYLLHDTLFRHAALLFFASLLAMIGNIVFQMVTGRMLPKAEYALMVTFLSLFMILGRPAGTLTTAMVHYIALLEQESRRGCVGRLLLKWILLTGFFSLGLMVVCIVFSSEIAGFFHLERKAPVIVSALALPAVFIGPVLLGGLRGLQRFIWLSLSQISLSIGRVVFGAVFLSVVFAACGWALAGHVAGMYLAMGVSVVSLLPLLRKSREKDLPKLPSLRGYLAMCMVVQFAYSILCSADVVLVKRLLPETPDFAYAATLGRMVTLMAAAVSGSLGPKVASSGAFTQNHRKVYLNAMGYALITVLGTLVVCLIIPNFLLRLLFGIPEISDELIGLTRGMACAMTPSILLGINTSLLLAQRRFKDLIIVVVCAVIYLTSVLYWHASAMQIVWIVGLTNLLGFIVTTAEILSPGNIADEE